MLQSPKIIFPSNKNMDQQTLSITTLNTIPLSITGKCNIHTLWTNMVHHNHTHLFITCKGVLKSCAMVNTSCTCNHNFHMYLSVQLKNTSWVATANHSQCKDRYRKQQQQPVETFSLLQLVPVNDANVYLLL